MPVIMRRLLRSPLRDPHILKPLRRTKTPERIPFGQQPIDMLAMGPYVVTRDGLSG